MLNWLLALLLAAVTGMGGGSGYALDVSFAGAPDGPPAGFTLYPDDPYAGLTVRGGALQFNAQGPVPGLAAGYAQVLMDAPVHRIGAEFRFTADADPRGAIALPVWSEPFNQTRLETPPRKPDAPVHVVVTRVDWAYQVYEGNYIVGLAAGRFDQPLPTGTDLTLEIRLQGDVADMLLPNGAHVTVTDPRIAKPARYATFESFVMDAAHMTRPQITRVWADT